MTMIDIITARAADMAAHDGVPVSAIHIDGAANQLQTELMAARDAVMQNRATIFAPAAAQEPAPVAQPEASAASAAPEVAADPAPAAE